MSPKFIQPLLFVLTREIPAFGKNCQFEKLKKNTIFTASVLLIPRVADRFQFQTKRQISSKIKCM